jgi:hypothetical protein
MNDNNLILVPMRPTLDTLVRVYNSLSAGDRRSFRLELARALPWDATSLLTLFHDMPDREKDDFLRTLRNEAGAWAPLMKGWADATGQELLDEWKAVLTNQVGPLANQFGEAMRQQDKKARDAKPRNVERDREIVRLKDVRGLTWGQIGIKLRLSRDAVRKAYKAQKKLG